MEHGHAGGDLGGLGWVTAGSEIGVFGVNPGELENYSWKTGAKKETSLGQQLQGYRARATGLGLQS